MRTPNKQNTPQKHKQLKMRQAVVAEALHSLGRFALDCLQSKGLVDSAIQVLTGDFNMVKGQVEEVLPPFQGGDSLRERWRVIPSNFGLSGDLLLVKGTNAQWHDVPIGKSYGTIGVRRDDHDAFGMMFQMRLPFHQTPARFFTVGAAQPAGTMQNCNGSLPIGNHTRLSVSAVGAAQPAVQQRMTTDAEISEMPNRGRDSKSPPQSLPRKSEADAVVEHAEGGHAMFDDDGPLNAPGVEPSGAGSGAGSGDSPHMPESLASTQPPKSDVGAFVGHPPGLPFATPLESLQPIPQESTLADSCRKLELHSPPDGAATHSLSDSESSDEFEVDAIGEADADSVDHAHKMMLKLREWFHERFCGAAEDQTPKLMHQLHGLLFAKKKREVESDYWFNPKVPEIENVVVSQNYVLERLRSVVLKREAWLEKSGLPRDHQMTTGRDGERVAFMKAMTDEYNAESHPQFQYESDKNSGEWRWRWRWEWHWHLWRWEWRWAWYWHYEFTSKQVRTRRHSRWHLELQRRAGCKQFWEIISYTGRLDMDTLLKVWELSVKEPEPDEAEEEDEAAKAARKAEEAARKAEEAARRAAHQTARLNAGKARSSYCRARRLEEGIQAGVKSAASLFPHERELLAGLKDDSLRTNANKLTMQVGHGTIWAKDGTQSMLGQNTRSYTRRVLDGFEATDLEDLDRTLYI